MNITVDTSMIENVTFDEIQIGQNARMVRTLTQQDIEAFAAVSGDTNPAHLDAEYADATLFHGIIGHGMWGGALISALLGTVFPGPGTIYLEQNLHFTRPVRVGDTLTINVTVLTRDEAKKSIELDCQVTNQNGVRVLYGLARVMAPTQRCAARASKPPPSSCSTRTPASTTCWLWVPICRRPAAVWCIRATSSRCAAPCKPPNTTSSFRC
jgi:phosphate acetyltransferase